MATLDELAVALRNADAAGDADAARALAGEITKMRGASPAAAEGSLGGAAKAGATGVAKGLIGIAGGPADALSLGLRGGDFVAKYLSGQDTSQPSAAKSIADTVRDAAGSQTIQKKIEETTGEFYKPQNRGEKYTQTIGEFAPGAIAGPGGVLRRFVTQAVLPGAASEFAGQATEGTKWEPYARVAGAILGGVAPNAIGRAITPAPASAARQRLVDILEKEGVTSITAGQRTGNEALRYAESTLGNAPLTGQQANRIARQGQEQFTDAVLKRAGTTGEATPEVLAANQKRLGDTFEDLAARNPLVMDMKLGQDLGKAVRHYERVPPSQQKAAIENYISDIMQHAKSGGVMPGPDYQAMRSMLSTQSKGVKQTDHYLSNALRDIRNALDDAWGRSVSPADREAHRVARREYGAQKVIEKAASRAGEVTAEGQIVPANLRNTVAAEDRGAYARGQGDFSELARAGAGVMAPLPNSGTAQRSNALKLLDTLTLGIPNAIGGRLLMSKPVQAYLSNQVATPLLSGNLEPGKAAVLSAMLALNQQRVLAPPK
jgi:hypothetical protein